MADEIRADYDRLEEAAGKFGNQAQAIQQTLGQVRGSMDPLEGGGWIGRGSDAFFEEMQSEVLPATERLQQALEEASRVTRQIIQIVKQAEEEASSPFRSG
jgi:WXG100 family type VII secretion target